MCNGYAQPPLSYSKMMKVWLVLINGQFNYNYKYNQEPMKKHRNLFLWAPGIIDYNNLLHLARASSIEEKQELFWKQGDFGYVKVVKDSLVTMCEPVDQV